MTGYFFNLFVMDGQPGDCLTAGIDYGVINSIFAEIKKEK